MGLACMLTFVQACEDALQQLQTLCVGLLPLVCRHNCVGMHGPVRAGM